MEKYELQGYYNSTNCWIVLKTWISAGKDQMGKTRVVISWQELGYWNHLLVCFLRISETAAAARWHCISHMKTQIDESKFWNGDIFYDQPIMRKPSLYLKCILLCQRMRKEWEDEEIFFNFSDTHRSLFFFFLLESTDVHKLVPEIGKTVRFWWGQQWRLLPKHATEYWISGLVQSECTGSC